MSVIQINGMSCQHCVASVKEAMEKIPGIQDVEVNLEQKQASYKGDVSAESVRDAIIKTGFEVME